MHFPEYFKECRFSEYLELENVPMVLPPPMDLVHTSLYLVHRAVFGAQGAVFGTWAPMVGTHRGLYVVCGRIWCMGAVFGTQGAVCGGAVFGTHTGMFLVHGGLSSA